jgi:hypothetical protein
MIRDSEHLRYVASLPCCGCGLADNTQAHHLLRTGQHGVALKSGDDYTIPLCHYCHSDLHRCGDEVGFFDAFNVDFETVKAYAQELYNISQQGKYYGNDY